MDGVGCDTTHIVAVTLCSLQLALDVNDLSIEMWEQVTLLHSFRGLDIIMCFVCFSGHYYTPPEIDVHMNSQFPR